MRAHLFSKGHLLTPALKEIRRTRAERLLQSHAENGHENILFTDEKFFTIEEQYNNQNKKIYAQTSLEVHSEGAGMPPQFYVIVWLEVFHQGVTHLHICKKGAKTGASVYQEDVLQGVVKHLNMTLFNGHKWVFQQDPNSAQNQDDSGVPAEERSGLYQRRGLALGESRPQPPGL